MACECARNLMRKQKCTLGTEMTFECSENYIKIIEVWFPVGGNNVSSVKMGT